MSNPTALSIMNVHFKRINSLFLCRNFKTTIYRQTVTNNYQMRCVITGSTGIPIFKFTIAPIELGIVLGEYLFFG
jgi:hypothetical protein